MVGDLAVTQRTESFFSEVGLRIAAAVGRAHPEIGATAMRVGDGAAVYAGAHSPVTQAIGLAIGTPIEDFEAVDRFYRERGADAVVHTTAFTHPSLLDALTSHGYRFFEWENVFARGLDDARPVSGIEIVEAGETDIPLWARIGAEAFATPELTAEQLIAVVEPLGRMPESRAYLAYVDGEPAGTATAITLPDRRLTGMFGAGTLERFRNRGVQNALLQRRLADARANGCDLAVVSTVPGTPSHRNVLRQGFTLLYTKMSMKRSHA